MVFCGAHVEDMQAYAPQLTALSERAKPSDAVWAVSLVTLLALVHWSAQMVTELRNLSGCLHSSTL